MRTTLSAMCLATVCSVVAFGQTPATKPQQPGAKPDAPITVVGCVAPGTAAGQYQLTNAMMASPMAQEKMSEKAKASAGATYLLTGGDNVKAHLGHKVEVTGTLARATGQDKAGEKPAEKPSKEGMSASMVRGTIAVASLKMVSTTCP